MNARTLSARHVALAAWGSLALLGAVASVPAKAADVGVSIGISQPGVYGRIDIGRFPHPQVVVQQPIYVHRPAPAVQPVYMWVPPGQQKNWRRYCGQYGACGAPVYFVQDGWYRSHVAPPRHAWRDDRRPGYGPGPRESYRDGYRDGWRRGDRDDDRDDRRGRGRGHGRDD